jgi:hypothetical protein
MTGLAVLMEDKDMKKRMRTREIIGLDESVEEFFWSGWPERGTAGWSLRTSRFFDQGQEIRAAWAQHKHYFLNKWKTEKRKGIPFVLSKEFFIDLQ